MEIRISRRFLKQYKKIPVNIREIFEQRRNLFLEDKHNPILNLHKLHGELKNYFSINITGDWRVLFKEESNEIIVFEIIGTHSQIYG